MISEVLEANNIDVVKNLKIYLDHLLYHQLLEPKVMPAATSHKVRFYYENNHHSLPEAT